MADDWKRVVVFLGTTREVRLGDRVAHFVVRQLLEKQLDVEIVDPLKFKLPLLTTPVHFYRLPDKPPQRLIDMNNKIKEADAIIVISAEYNHSIPPALSNTMDYFDPIAYSSKPSGIITYSPGIVGGARAAVQLRSFLGILGCISVPLMVNISKAHLSLSEDGIPQNNEEGSHMVFACENLLKELEWWANAAKAHRNKQNTTFKES